MKFFNPSIVFKSMLLLSAIVPFISHSLTELTNSRVSLVAMEYPPYYGSELDKGGLLTDIVRTVFSQFDIAIEVDYVPFARAIRWAQEGKIDGVIGLWKTSQRQQFLVYSHVLMPNKMGFFTRKGLAGFNPYRQKRLNGKILTMSVVRGYALPEKLSALNLPITWATDSEQSLTQLASGRVDMIYVDLHHANYILDKPEFAAIKAHLIWQTEGTMEHPQYLALVQANQQSPLLLELFNTGLHNIKQNGVYNLILQKHKIAQP